MTASALNSASLSVPAAGAAGATATATTGGAGGFEDLMAALFPQDATAGAPVAPQASTAAPATNAMPADAEDAAAPQEQVAAATTEGATAADPASTLAAVLAAQQQVLTPPQTPTIAAQPAAGSSAPAWGRDKAKGVPAQPALAHANPKADLLGKNGLTPETEGETPAPTGETIDAALPAAPQPAAQSAPRATPATPAQPTLPTPAAANMPAAAPGFETPAEAAPAPAPAAVDAAPPETAAVQAQTQIAARAPSRAEPATPSPRSQRPERKGSDLEARADHLKPLEAADKPVHAKAVDAAKPAAAAGADDAKPSDAAEAAEAEVSADAPDATPPGDAKSAAHSPAPAAQAGHVVRGAPETVANLAAQIVKKLEGQSTRFDLELNPHGLGKVDVRIEIGAQGQLTAAMLFDNAQAAQELKSRATELQRALEEAGFNLSGGLSFDVADQGRQQGHAWQDQADTGRAFRGQAFRAALETAGDADVASHGALRLRRGVNAGVDVRI